MAAEPSVAFPAEPALRIGQYIRQLVLTVATLWALLLIAEKLKSSYDALIPQETSTDQSDYLDYISDKSTPALWVELGKEGRRQLPKITNRNYSLGLRGFHQAGAWSRAIGWSLRIADSASITIRFRDRTPTTVALYLTDGDSHWRMGVIRTANQSLVVDRLHNGRWVEIPILKEQLEKKEIHLELSKLTGDDLAVSALAVFE